MNAHLPALSILDLAPVIQDGTPGQALRNSRDLAQHAERLGFQRYWRIPGNVAERNDDQHQSGGAETGDSD